MLACFADFFEDKVSDLFDDLEDFKVRHCFRLLTVGRVHRGVG